MTDPARPDSRHMNMQSATPPAAIGRQGVPLSSASYPRRRLPLDPVEWSVRP